MPQSPMSPARPAGTPPIVPLTREENVCLTHVTGTAPMGRFLAANYWMPAIQSYRLTAGGMPLRVRLLGRTYVAFRADDGRVGLFDEHCPHRRVSLTLARNEDNALRCIYHGWKFGVDGTVLEAPTQPFEREAFCRKVPLRHYATHEAAGLVWVFLGSTPPPLPDFPFMAASGPHVATFHHTIPANWVQIMDGFHDSAHIGVLHQDFLGAVPGNADVAAAAADPAPTYEFMDRPGGVRFAAIRALADGRRYFRISEYVAPFYNFIAYKQGYCEISVPADDETTDKYLVQWNLDDPVSVAATTLDDPFDWPPVPAAGPGEYWGQDRAAMARGAFSGFDLHGADIAVVQSQGVISDREEEFLSDGDVAVQRIRRLLIDAARSFASGIAPPIAWHAAGAYSQVWVGDLLLGPGHDWRTETLAR